MFSLSDLPTHVRDAAVISRDAFRLNFGPTLKSAVPHRRESLTYKEAVEALLAYRMAILDDKPQPHTLRRYRKYIRKEIFSTPLVPMETLEKCGLIMCPPVLPTKPPRSWSPASKICVLGVYTVEGVAGRMLDLAIPPGVQVRINDTIDTDVGMFLVKGFVTGRVPDVDLTVIVPIFDSAQGPAHAPGEE